MRPVSVIAVVVLLSVLSSGAQTIQNREWFDEYGAVAWSSERLELDNFAVYLAMNKSMIGYVAFVRGRNESSSHFESRIARVKAHMIRRRGLEPKRLVIVRVRKRKGTHWTVLQPVENDVRPPDFDKALGG